MKKVAEALSDAVKDLDAFDSIMSALESDLDGLLARLRAGIASNAEQALAADLIEGKKKPTRPKGLPWYQRRELASIMIAIDKAYPYGHPRGTRQGAIDETIKYAKRSGYKVSPRYLYKMLAEFDPHILAKMKALHERPTRVKKRFAGETRMIGVDGEPVDHGDPAAVEITIGKTELREPAGDVRNIDHDNLVLLVEAFLARK